MKTDMNLLAVLCQKLLISFMASLPLVHSVLAAENEQYISPRLQLGLHTEASLDSPVKQLISSGMAVTVLKIEKEFSKIKLDEGTQGWIKSKFLTQEKPAELRVKQLEQELLKAQEQLSAAKAENTNTMESEDTDNESSESGLSQSQVDAYEETIASLKTELNAWEQLDSQDKRAQEAQAFKMNQELKERLSQIAVLATGKQHSADFFSSIDYEMAGNEDLDLPFLQLLKRDYLFNFIIGGICFFLGIFLMDMINRRRHGGYRI